MVARHVRDHCHIVPVVTEPLPEDAAAGDLEDGRVDDRVLKDHLG